MKSTKLAIILGAIGIIISATLAAAIQQTTINNLQEEISELTKEIERIKTKLEILVFHVSEKGAGYSWGQLPNATYTYNQILALNNNTYEILLLPEYKGHLNWTEELAWLSATFGGPRGIPIMLDVFGGGNETTPVPMLTTEDISAAMSVVNVKYLRFAEVVSWHMEEELPFPTDYIAEILDFCKANNLKLFWTEWKNDSLPTVETFKAIQTCIEGYEDIVTVSFSTNSQDLEPTDGFLQLNRIFARWGTSIQSWYWKTRYGNENMPASLLLEHALSAKGIDAKIIQFEPYWYFFDNGEPNENLKLLMSMLT